MHDALILTVAPNGAYKTRRDHPAVPLTPAELAQTAKACLAAGAAMLHLHVRRPDGSHSLRELCRPTLDRAMLADFFQHLRSTGVMAQVILYDVEDLRQWQALQRDGVIPPGPWLALFVLGRYSAGQTSAPADLLPYLQAWDLAEPWAMCAFGAQEYRCAMAAAALGGHVRVGFENNLLLQDGTPAADNAAGLRARFGA